MTTTTISGWPRRARAIARRRVFRAILPAVLLALVSFRAAGGEWKAAWAASAQGPYPSGYPIAQPDLSRVFPDPAAGAENQSFRMLLRPCLWGERARLRFTNVFGSKPLTIADVFVGLHAGSGAVVPGTNVAVRFGGGDTATVAPGESVWSDPVALAFVGGVSPAFLSGRKLAVSFHVPGQSGPMTWHAVANGTSYLSPRNSGSVSKREDEGGFPFSTSSWFFIDAVDMVVAAETRVIACLGDSITDGVMSTMNGDDSWPDCLWRLAEARERGRVSVVNAGICGNTLLVPPGVVYTPHSPMGGGPAMLERLERDILSLSGLTAVIVLAGINDIAMGGRTADEVADGYREIVAGVKGANPAVRVVGGTLTSSLGATVAEYGNERVDAERRRLNAIIRDGGIFDAVVDFDAALLDAETGRLRGEFVPDSLYGSPGDFLHPNRLGYLRMAESVPHGVTAGR